MELSGNKCNDESESSHAFIGDRHVFLMGDERRVISDGEGDIRVMDHVD